MHSVRVDDPRIMGLPSVARRFLRYVQIDTQSDPESSSTPSTERQTHLSRLLATELREAGLGDVELDEFGYVYGTVPARRADGVPPLGLLAHVDTSPDEPGAADPLVHFGYGGGVIRLPAGDVRLDPAETPELLDHIGHDVITSDGSTLLGSDDKAGVAILTQLAEDLVGSDAPRPELRLCFTVDEEIGRGVDKLDLTRFGARVAYTVDGGGTNAVYSETFNAAEAVLEVEGVMVHPGYAKGIMVNAVRIVGEFIAALPSDEAPETTSGREGYIHPHTVFEGDPARVRLKLILRDFSEEGLARRKQFVTSLVERLRERHPRAHLSLTIRDQYRNMRAYIDGVDSRAVEFVHATAEEMGFALDEKLVRGGTDGARLSELGIPTPNLFTGGHDFHSRFEWNTVQNLEQALAFVKALVGYWARHGAP